MCKSLTFAALAAFTVLGFGTTASAVETPPYASATEAYRLGVAALKTGEVEVALPALEYAADRGVLGAQYKLARIYAAGGEVRKDDAKAYSYYRQIVNQRADISPLSPVSKYVAEAFVALGEYYRTGIESSGLRPNPRRAADLFRHAGSIFGSADAQYQLARLYLEGVGVEKDVSLAVNWLATAAKKRHVLAQATLGEILWRGRDDVRPRPARGLALIMLAHANATANGAEPQWIANLYFEALGSADPTMLKQAQAMTSEWGGPAIVIDLTPDPIKPAPQQIVVPASEGTNAVAQPAPVATPAGTVVSNGAVPAAPMSVPLGFAPPAAQH